jgi:hypothetical protein
VVNSESEKISVKTYATGDLLGVATAASPLRNRHRYGGFGIYIIKTIHIGGRHVYQPSSTISTTSAIQRHPTQFINVMHAICCTLREDKAHSMWGNSCRPDCNSVRLNHLDVGRVSMWAWSQLCSSLEGKNVGNTFPTGLARQENRVNMRWIVSAAGALSDDDHGRPNWKLCIDPVYIIRIDRLWQPISLKDYWYRSGTDDTKNQLFCIV